MDTSGEYRAVSTQRSYTSQDNVSSANTLIHDSFAQIARRWPDRIALCFADHQLSYGRLDRLSSSLASNLVEHGVTVDQVVGVSAPRSVELIVGMLAILKTGAAYLPLDPGYPRNLLQHMIEDSGVRLVLTEHNQIDFFKSLHVSTLDLLGARDGWHSRRARILQCPSGDNLAYLIYTSGSTGRPKGIMVSHNAVMNHIYWRQEAFALGSSDKILQRTPVSFDISVWEVFGALTLGMTLVLLPPGDHRHTDCVVDTIIQEEITTLEIVPSILKLILQEPQFSGCTSLRYVFSGGEPLPGDLAEKCQSLLPATLVNVYGPTETTIWSTFWTCSRNAGSINVPIGRPITNTSAHVLDPTLWPQSAEEEGMLCIGGHGLARGYWRRPDLTADAFLPDSESGQTGKRLYKTGDFVYQSQDNILSFVGRKDTQVKVRGVRIELQEIEHVLKSCPVVADGFVMVRTAPDGDKKLVCYYVLKQPDNTAAVNAFRHARYHEIRSFMASRLPESMLPNHFRNIDETPLLPNGKVNTTALPEPAYYTAGGTNADPENEKERVLAKVWCEVLGVPTVNCEDLFSWYGGDSLQLMEVRTLAQRHGLFIDPAVEHYGITVRSLADSAVWITAPAVSVKARLQELGRWIRLAAHAKLYELLDSYYQRQTLELESPDRKRFRDFYESLENKRDIFYLFLKSGLLHWAVKQLEFIPKEVNLVLIGTALTNEERAFVAEHIDRPFFHVNLEIDSNAAWEFLFQTNRYNFGWIDVGCFVNNSSLFRELCHIEPDVAVNSIYTHTERHRRLFLEYFVFVNVRAIRELEVRKIRVYPGQYNYCASVRRGHFNAHLRVPRSQDRKLMRQIMRQATGGAVDGFRGWLASHKLFELSFFSGHLFYLHAQQFGFRIKRVRHLTEPSDVNGLHNFFSDEVITALYIPHYERVYTSEKFAGDLRMTMQAEYLILRDLVDRLPATYTHRLGDITLKMLRLGLTFEDASKNVIDYLTRFGVSPQVFERRQWSFLRNETHNGSVSRYFATQASA